MAWQYCSVERDGHVTLVTIKRAEVMNALHPPANFELEQIFDEFAADPGQWVAILTGAGDRAFSAGNDLKFAAELAQRGERISVPKTGFGGLTSRFDLTKPVIAAVNGLALGGGFEMALATDLIIAAESAQFALPEPKVGMVALAGGLQRLPRQIGLKQAMGLILTGRRVSAARGEQLGFVNQVVAPQELLPTARSLAAEIIQCSPRSVRASKQAALRGLDEPDLASALTHQRQYPAMRDLLDSEDVKEGPRAFAEKRAPRWQDV